jgi:hypothetical protein
MLAHTRCLGCGILAGPRHVEVTLLFGLCSTCARGGPVQEDSRVLRPQLHAKIGGSSPGVHGLERGQGQDAES